jgi:hypothetical protein
MDDPGGWWEERKDRVEVLKNGWRFRLAAKEAGMWVDLIPVECPECHEKGEWPDVFAKPNCGRCYLYRGEEVQMRKFREPVPPPPPKRTTRDELECHDAARPGRATVEARASVRASCFQQASCTTSNPICFSKLTPRATMAVW